QIVVEDHDIVPFGALAPLARVAVAPRLRGRHAHIDHGIAGGQPPDLGVRAEIAYQNDLVDAARHDITPLVLRSLPSHSDATVSTAVVEDAPLSTAILFFFCSMSTERSSPVPFSARPATPFSRLRRRLGCTHESW